MPYTPTSWVSGTTPVDAPEMNNIETAYTEATGSFEQDLFTPFVQSGLVCTKDGSVPNKLDVTAGVAFPKQADATLRRRAPAASNQTTSVVSTTYYLFLNSDGTWTWGTSSSGPTNSLPICQATTDGSGNISVVTDARPLNTTVLAGMAGVLQFLKLSSDSGAIYSDGAGHLTMKSLGPGPINTTSGNIAWLTTAADSHSGKGWSFYTFQDGSLVLYEWTVGTAGLRVAPGGDITAGGNFNWGNNGANDPHLQYYAANNATQMWTPQAGAAQWLELVTWNGTATKVPLGIGSAASGNALAYVDDSGHFQDASGQVIVAGGGNLANTPLEFIVVGPTSANLPAAGTKGRIAIVVPFSLP